MGICLGCGPCINVFNRGDGPVLVSLIWESVLFMVPVSMSVMMEMVQARYVLLISLSGRNYCGPGSHLMAHADCPLSIYTENGKKDQSQTPSKCPLMAPISEEQGLVDHFIMIL